MRATWTGLDAFAAALKQAVAANPTPLMRRVAEHGRSSTVARIAGGGLAPNAPATVAAKGSATPLVDSGRYLQSISVAYGTTFAAWGSNDVRARLLNDGGTVRPTKAKFLAFPPDRRARALVRRYGSPRAAVDGVRGEGYRVWTRVRPDGQSGVVLAARPGAAPFVLLVLKASVRVPARRHYLLDAADRTEIERLVREWLSGVVT